MEKQTMFMLKCLDEGKNIPGRRQGTVLCLLFPGGKETQNRPLPPPRYVFLSTRHFNMNIVCFSIFLYYI